jgi:hypothetical protein
VRVLLFLLPILSLSACANRQSDGQKQPPDPVRFIPDPLSSSVSVVAYKAFSARLREERLPHYLGSHSAYWSGPGDNSVVVVQVSTEVPDSTECYYVEIEVREIDDDGWVASEDFIIQRLADCP